MSGRSTCVSGSPSRTLNSMTFGTVGGQHQADKEKAAEGMPFGRHAGDDGLDDLAHDPRLERGIHQRTRRKGAHAARVRPAVIVEHPLVILRRADGDGARAVADREERDLGTGQTLFDHDPIAGRAEFPIQHRVGDRPLRGGAILGDHDALAGGETVGLQHDRQSELVAADRIERVVERLADTEARGRDAVTRHERLCERLARFEARGRGHRAEQQAAVVGEAIGNAQTQRELGSDDGEVDLFAFSERARGFRIGQVDRHGAGQLGDTRDFRARRRSRRHRVPWPAWRPVRARARRCRGRELSLYE